MTFNLSSVLSAAGFINTSIFANSMELALVSGIPIMYYGKGGYGKTEMIKKVFNHIDGSSAMLECDPETTASLIKGGAIARTTKTDKEDITLAHYNVGASILRNHAFFYEEMLDASFQALSVLKAIITNKQLTLNGEVVDSINKLLVAATNVNPYDRIEQLPPSEANSYDAFLQRFIIVRHEWDTHDNSDYNRLLRASVVENKDTSKISIAKIDESRSSREEVKLDKELQGILCSLAEKSANEGRIISPRMFKWTIRMIKSQAQLSDKSTATIEQLNVLNYLPSWDQSLLSNLEEEIQQQKIYNEANTNLKTLQDNYDRANSKVEEYKTKGDIVKLLALVNVFQLMEIDINKVNNIPDSLVSKRNELINYVVSRSRDLLLEIPRLASATVTK
jgi:MoxR-like ATPase